MGDDAFGINRATIVRMVEEVAEITRMGVEVAVVIGGGNIYRGMNEADMVEIADIITQVLDHPTDETVHAAVRARVKELCGRYPIYAW